MKSEDCILDIHICGACRSEFSDIYKFIQHKRECYLSAARSQGQVSELANLAGQFIQHLHSSDGVQLHLSGTDFHNETYPCSSAQSGDDLENTDISSASSVQISLSSVLPTSVYSLPDYPRKDSSHFAQSLKSAAVFEHKSLDVTAPYTYSWPADSEVHEESVSASVGNCVTESELSLATEVVAHSKESVKAESLEDESKSHFEISADNIAVYVMSPKSFASSMKTEQTFFHDAGNKSLSDFSMGSFWSETHSQTDQSNHTPDVFNNAAVCVGANSKKSFMNIEGEEQQKDLMFIYQDNVGHSKLKSGTSSVFYNDSEFTFTSNNSTPCPEDLEVGQISAAMFGKKNQHEDLKLILNVSTGQAMTSAAESVQDAVKASFLNVSSVVSQTDAYKMFTGDIDSIHGYIRENTASAPIIKEKKDLGVSNKRRISVEKRERLQGISDDLLSSSVRVTSSCGGRGQGVESLQEAKSQVSNGNFIMAQLPRKSTELPPVTNPCLVSGYKAVFTSPSSGGHRLTPTHADLSERSKGSLRDVSSLNRQFFTRGSTAFVSKSVEYKNISALMQVPGRQSQAELPSTNSGQQLQEGMPYTASEKQQQGELSHLPLGFIFPGKKRERRINFETIGRAESENPEKLKFISNEDVVLPALQKNQMDITQDGIKSLDKNNTSAVISSLNTPMLNLTKTATSASANEVKDIDMNADGSVQLKMANENTHQHHHHKDDVPIPIVNILQEVQMCTGELPNIDSQVMTSSDQKPELSVTSQNDDCYENFLTSCANNNTSIVMIYKNVDGSVIMVPKMLYSTAQQKNSTVAGISNSKTKLSLTQEHINHKKSHNKQTSEFESSFSNVHSHEDASQCFYLHTSGIENQPIEASSSDNSAILTNSVGFSTPNQLLSVISNSSNIKNSIQRTDMPQKLPVSISTLNGPAIAEKEKFIIKPKKAEGSSTSPVAVLSQINKNTKRTSQILQMKDLLVCDVTEQTEDKTSRTFTCKFDQCRYTTSLYKDFQRHYRRHTGEKPYQCPDCGKTFNRSDKLKIHQRRHTGLKPFQCHMCDYAAIEGGSLKKHMRIHTDERPFKCQICAYASRNSSQLIVHLRTHTGDCPFHCTKCPAKFKINSDLKRHMRVHTGEKPFQCDKCDYKSSNKGNLKTHVKINHLEENEINCPACQFVTSSRKRFREHERVHNVLVVKCTQCEYTCANFGQLRSHAIIHNSIKPFRCKFCSYSSRQSGNLKKHVHNMHLHKLRAKSKNVTVEGNIPVKLPGTRRENVLLPISERPSIHKRRSTPGCRKLHSCQECGTSFVREDSLRCHMKQHSMNLGESIIDQKADEQPQSETTEDDFQRPLTTNTETSTFYGIQQIVAAASKIYEENYGAIMTTNKLPAARTKSFTLPDYLSGHSIDHSKPNHQSLASSHSHTTASTEIKLKKKRKVTVLSQLPWENGSDSASVSSPYNDSLPSSSLDDMPAALSSHIKTQTCNIEEPSSQLLQSKNIQRNLTSTKDKSFRSLNQQTGKLLRPDLTKVIMIEKSFLSPLQLSSTSELTPLSQLPPKADYVGSQSAVSTQRATTVPVQSMMSSDSSETNPAVILAHQEAGISSINSLQVVPKFQSSQPAPGATQGTRTLPPLSVNTMSIQLQPSSQVQLVMPVTTISKPAQLVSAQENSVIPQHILLQVQGSSEVSQVFTIPIASFNSLQTTGQILPHIVNHFTLQSNGLVNSKVSQTAESQSADTQMLAQPTLQLSESIPNIVTSHLCGVPES